MNGPSSSAGASPELSPAFALAGRLAAGETLFVGWVGLPGLAQVEIVARAGFDALVFDLQHGLFDIGDVVGMIGAAAAAGRPSIVRVGVEDFAAASRALDFGAAGVIAPMINSAADARRFVEFVKYLPLGRRSWGPGRAMNLSGVTRPADHLAQANGFTIALAMIETREGLANLDAILAVDGIDGVFVGPMDLSIALSEGRDVDATGPRLDEPLFRVAAAAARVGKIAGIFGGAGARASALASRGFRFVTVGHDIAYVSAGIAAMLAAARAE